MNARVAKILVTAIAAAASVAACASRPGDAVSAPDARVSGIVEANRTYPRWRDFPGVPAPLPADATLAAAGTRLDAGRTALARDAAAIDWTLSDPDAFAAVTRSRVDATGAMAVTQETAESLEVFAESLRERGRAPPPISRPRQP